MANLLWLLSKLDLRNVVDILLVATVIYGLLWLVRGTQAVQLLRGVILLALLVVLIGSIAGFTAFNWLMRSGAQALVVVVAVVLQPELRRALERVGRAGVLALRGARELDIDRMIRELSIAARHLSERRHGALIVIERETGLQDYIETGVEIDSLVTDELVQTIFSQIPPCMTAPLLCGATGLLPRPVYCPCRRRLSPTAIWARDIELRSALQSRPTR